MARPTVRKQLERPGGGSGARAKGRLRLIAAVDGEGYGYAGTANVDVAGIHEVTADSTGLLSFTNVRPNSGASDDVITLPAGTVYELTVSFPNRSPLVEYVSVPDVTGPVWVKDCLTVSPTDLPPPSAVTPSALSTALTGYLPTSQKAAPSGVASLDSGTKVPAGQIPDLSGTYVAATQKATANGVASLDGAGKVPAGQVPDLSSTYLTAAQKAAALGVASLDSGTKIPVAQLPLATTSADGAMSSTDKQYAVVTPVRHYYVSTGTGASDSNNGLSWRSAFSTLAGAITAIGGTTNNTNRAVIHLGYGTWGSSSSPLPTHTIKGVRGFVIQGLGPELTTLWGPDGGALIKAVNTYQFMLRDLTYAGSPTGTGWGLEITADWNGTGFTGSVEPTQSGATNCYFGTRVSTPISAAYGVRWSLNNGDWHHDANNDQGMLRDCCFFSIAQPIEIGHSNSLNHRIEGCRFDVVAGGIVFRGGSATVVSANFESTASTGWMFDLQPAAGSSSLVTQTTPRYRHAIAIIGTQSEAGQMGWVRADAGADAGATSALTVQVIGGEYNGGGIGGASGPVVDWSTTATGSLLSFSHASLVPRFTGGYISAPSSEASLSFTGCHLSLYNYQWGGRLDFVRCQSDRAATFTPSGTATVSETMCTGTGFAGGTTIAGQPVITLPVGQSTVTAAAPLTNANLMTTAMSAGVSGWSATTNTTLTNNVALTDGLAALQLTAVASSIMGGAFLLSSTYVPVTAGASYTFRALFRAATTARAVRVDTVWYDSSKVAIGSTVSGPTVNDNATTWTAASNTLTAPATAAYTSLTVRVPFAAAGETHYARQIGIAPATYALGQLVQPTLSYDRANETPAGAELRQALTAIGAVKDATSGTTGSLTASNVGGMYSVSTLGEHVMSPLMAGTGTTSVAVVNGGLAVRIKPRRDITVASLVWYSTAASGNHDIAILDAAGARLWSKGATAWPAPGTITETVTGVTLTSGIEYWLLFAADNTTGAFRGMAASAASGEQTKDMTGTAAVLSVAATAYPVPSTVTLGSTATGRVPLIQLRE